MQFPKPPPDRRKKTGTQILDKQKNKTDNERPSKSEQQLEEQKEKPKIISYEELFKGLKDDDNEKENENNTIKRVRKIQNQKMRDKLKDYTILTSNTQDREKIPKELNLILFGPTGSGKSSLIKQNITYKTKQKLIDSLNEVDDLPNDIKKDFVIQTLHHNEGTKKLTNVTIKKGKLQLIETGNNTFTIENSSINCLDTRGQIYLSQQEMAQFNLIIDVIYFN